MSSIFKFDQEIKKLWAFEGLRPQKHWHFKVLPRQKTTTDRGDYCSLNIVHHRYSVNYKGVCITPLGSAVGRNSTARTVCCCQMHSATPMHIPQTPSLYVDTKHCTLLSLQTTHRCCWFAARNACTNDIGGYFEWDCSHKQKARKKFWGSKSCRGGGNCHGAPPPAGYGTAFRPHLDWRCTAEPAGIRLVNIFLVFRIYSG